VEETEKAGPNGRIYERLFVRHWDTWSDGRCSHPFVLPVAGGEAVDLMKTMDAGREDAWSANFDLFAASRSRT